MERHATALGTLTLTGEGHVTARPDIVHIDLGVATEAKTAQEAASRNAQLMSQVLARIKTLGIPAQDLQTTGFNISPVIDWDERSPTRGQVTGYRVENTLSVRTAVETAGKVLDEGVAAGANVAGGLRFGLRDESPHRQRAIAAAIKDARAEAEAAARALGVSLTGTRGVEILYGGAPVLMRAAVRAEKAAPIEPGQLNITASVRLIFEFGEGERPTTSV